MTTATHSAEHIKEFTLPDLGEGLTEAEIVRWLIDIGDRVSVDQPVVEVETAKAVVEVPCPYSGVVTRLWAKAGELLDVGRPLLSVAEVSGSGANSADTPSPAPEGSGNVLVGYGTATPGTRRRRRRSPASAMRATATSPKPTRDGPARVISPLVRRLARERGVDLRTVPGSGPDGLILRKDIDRHVDASGARESMTSASSSLAVSRPDTTSAVEPIRVPLRGVRRTVAEKLARSRREIPDASTWVDVDATQLLDSKRLLTTNSGASGASGEPVSLLALLALICVAALRRYPELNATVDADRQEIIRLPSVHLGFAAQTDRGLVVPVVQDADRMNLSELSAEIRRLTAAARADTLAPGELTGGTFTLNNYGVFGVDGSTPIINHPEAAMLGVGRIMPRPWAVGGAVDIRQVCQVSFTFDHRVCDGGAAGGFLRLVADLMEQPLRLLHSL